MNFSDLIFWAGVILAGVVLLIGVFVVISICWAASGSPDVNGDPERDSGLDDDDIRAMSAHWDHGSKRSHRVPDLETARQLNRIRMCRDVSQIRAFLKLHQIHPHG